MSEKLRVGIIGAGWAGGAHAEAFSRLPDVEVAALWSRTHTTAESLAGRMNNPKIHIYDRWQDLVGSGELDVVSLTTPPTLRLEPFAMALEQGSHVLVEKPLSVGLTDARAIVEKAHQSDTITATCFNWRYAPGNQIALRAVKEGKIGKILDVRLEWRLPGLTGDFFRQRPWTADLNLGDGLIGEGLSHEFDRSRYFTGSEFTRVVSRLVSRPVPLEPEYVVESGLTIVLAELTGDVLGNFRVTMTAGMPDLSFTVNGERGMLHVTHDAASMQCIDEEEVSLDIPETDRVPDGTELQQHTWNRLVSDFVSAIRKGDKGHAAVTNLATLKDGLRAQEVIAAGRLSEKERRWVELDELE
jgi:predicted dehydrogenase